MAVLLDTGVIYAYYDRTDAWHARALSLLKSETGGLIVPAPVIPEVDHLLGHRLGAKARQVFGRSLADGDYAIADLPHDRFARVADLNVRFESLQLEFVDAAIIAISEVTTIRRIGTSDRRHFGPLAVALKLELVP